MRLILHLAGSVIAGLIASLSQAQITDITVSMPGASGLHSGRLFVVFSRDFAMEPRLAIGEDPAPREASPFFAMDLVDWDGAELTFQPSAGFPLATPAELEPGIWNMQVLLDVNTVLSDLDSPGNRYSEPETVGVGSVSASLSVELTNAVPAEILPVDRELLKFVRIRSTLLSDFYDTDIYLRASVLLPRDHGTDPGRRYPVLYHVAGLNGRYDRSLELLENEEFMTYWQDGNTAPAVIVFLDGESPFGDSYQVNSAVSGPYADANFFELFPFLVENFPIRDQASSRFVSGCSTGGWVSMALQILYPDYFNGAYSLSPDSPSFQAFQLVNLYQDETAYYSTSGMIRPSARRTNGDPLFSIADEIRMEAAMGREDSFVNSGQQWGTWNAVYGQPDVNGDPIPVWDQDTGEIDSAVVNAWRRWDLDRFVRDNWRFIGTDLAGKLQFWMGDMDDYYLTNGLRILEQTLNVMEAPAADAQFTWIPYHGHCDFGIQVHYIDVLEDMQKRAAGN